MTTAEFRRQHPEIAKRWRDNTTRNAKAKAEAERAAIRERMADYKPANVRTYGEPWDSRIAAAGDAMYPGDRGPHRSNG